MSRVVEILKTLHFERLGQFLQVSRSKLTSGDTLMSAMTHLPDSNPGQTALPSDRDLLRRFIFDGDEVSFAAIVERHATLVMSVCRRVVGQSPDVDDAFQATFFALSQRPASIFECRSLTGWLYSVAWRASVRLVRLRKRTMTQPLPDQVPASEPDPLDVIAQASDLASLDEELNQLPQKYRDVLVMSYFAQQTNQEIADQLNESKGAVDGRIRDARRMLRVRLARRGVEVGVLAVATAYVQSSASAATPALIQKAISLGAPGIVSQEPAALNAAEVAQMKLLTSTGIPLMSKIGLTIAAGLVVATGLWGMTHLAAFQDAIGEGGVVTIDTTDGDAVQRDETNAELQGRTEATAVIEPTSEDEVGQAAVPGSTIAPAPVVELAGHDGSGMGSASAETPPAKPRRPLTGAAAEFSRRSERDAERRLNEMMQTERTVDMQFPGDNPLTDILEQMSTALIESQSWRVAVRPDVKAFADDAIILSDVIIKDIEIAEGQMTVGSALDHILSQTDPKLTWIAKDELILITTESAAEADENMFLRSYDISRLREISQLTVSTWDTGGGMMGGGGEMMGGGGGGFFSVALAPSQFGGGQGGGGQGGAGPGGAGTPVRPRVTRTQSSHPAPRTPAEDGSGQGVVISWESGLIQTVQDLTGPPCHWIETDGEGGRMSVAGNRLIVRQSRKGHEQVVAVLEQLEMAADDAAEEKQRQ